MPFVKRDETGAIIAVSQQSSAGFDEELSAEDAAVQAFLAGLEASNTVLDETDQDFIRVLEDVVQLLIDKGVILFTDLPESAQSKIMRRQKLRSKLSRRLDLIGDD